MAGSLRGGQATKNLGNYDERMLLSSARQPLCEHLTLRKYRKMVVDSKKYLLYQLAIVSAIDALTQAGTSITKIGVVGAGFGGLVQSVLEAMRKTKLQCAVIAMDKNPVALAELRHRHDTEADWKQVDVLDADMRDNGLIICFFGQVDILVSDLLGGFGDNELAPECLISWQRLLKPTGVAIPRSTQSYLAPVHARSLRRVLLNSQDPNDRERWWAYAQHLCENTDVVLLAQPLPVFAFVYPHKKGTLYRRRCLRFSSSSSCKPEGNLFNNSESWCHGFMGYFEAELHGTIRLSTLPGRATPEFNEWDPVFFPAKSTFCLPAQLNIRRLSSPAGDRVWYSWSVTDDAIEGEEQNARGMHCYISTNTNTGAPGVKLCHSRPTPECKLYELSNV
jgi:protein arginine N-methyltransferase 5